jgi:hypothetical protein
MKNLVLAMFATFTMTLAACGVEQDDNTPGTADTPDPNDSAETAAPTAGLKQIPAELSLAPAPGCAANVTCSGAKTCGAWSAYYTCSAPYLGCNPKCGQIPGRGSACVRDTVYSPQNRTRACVMRASGQTCIEVDYRLDGSTCPGE